MIATQGRKAKQFATPEERLAYDRERLEKYQQETRERHPNSRKLIQKRHRIMSKRGL